MNSLTRSCWKGLRDVLACSAPLVTVGHRDQITFTIAAVPSLPHTPPPPQGISKHTHTPKDLFSGVELLYFVNKIK